ncbi:transcriptional regulator, MerR family [Coriobacterium glomerans PW2]|uniref:Transcriptional regulator, MerR family n=1 Tax=Coriobacterium glomerans (strain ATCC 49209 / DSM 20642 / JCM 10262 / PW2) TaxID=700015 RepID=F2N6W2_CORGP|nr:MerR family transcriptional regulator [Coriobacterium glomerans]AEB06161.1 transcriptional regulator, MerR family [Coriobacterium glomerans PW2]
MFRIGEFSKLAEVSIRMLRYYDAIGILKPAEVDKWTGHRLYSVEQIPRLNKILYLRDSGFNVDEIAHVLDMDDYLLLEHLERKRSEINRVIQGEQKKLKKIAIAKDEIQCNKSELHYNISIKSIPGQKVLSLRKIVPTYHSEGDLWNEISAFAKDKKIKISNNTFSIYHDTEYKERDVDIELCAPVNTLQKNTPMPSSFCFRITEPIQTMASTMVYGDFSNISGAYIAFSKWLQKNSQYRMLNPMRQIVHRGPWNENDSLKFLIEIQIPLELE